MVNLYYDHVIIKHISNKSVIGKGEVMVGCYLLKVEEVQAHENVVTTQRSHQRLGYPSFNKMKCLDNVLNCEKKCISNPCTICPTTKQKRLPSISENNISNTPFELIRCDIWGPYHINFHRVFRYFINIVDDCTRHTWIYLIRNKSEPQTVIRQIFSMIHRQFGTNIKSFRSDNAKELHFTKFF